MLILHMFSQQVQLVLAADREPEGCLSECQMIIFGATVLKN